MLFSRTSLQHMVLFGALFGVLSLLAISSPGRAEPSALDDAPASKEEKPDTEKPKAKRAVTVPAGTVMLVRTGEEVSSNDKAGRRFSATLEANLLAGDEVVAKAGSEIYGEVQKSQEIGRGVVVNTSALVLNLTQIIVDGTLYPIVTGNFSEKSTGVLLKGKRAVTVPKGSILEFSLTQPLTVGK